MGKVCTESMTFEGFNQQFEAFMGMYATYRKAYLAVETIHERKFGGKKYASYESFAEVRRRKIVGKQMS
jgi:hypothetical protein